MMKRSDVSERLSGLRAKACQQFMHEATRAECVVPGCNFAVALMLEGARVAPLRMIPSISRPGSERTPVTSVGVAQKAGMMRFDPVTRSYHVTMRGEEWLLKLEGTGMLKLARELQEQMDAVMVRQLTEEEAR